MDNQHQKIKGYRDLSGAEIELMNEIKAKAEECRELCAKLLSTNVNIDEPGFVKITADGRWVNIGQTHLQQGFMALVRSVAKPESF